MATHFLTTLRDGAVVAALGVAMLAAAPARAEDDAPNYAGDLTSRDALLGDFGGARTRLLENGVQVEATVTGDASTNVSGGLRRGEGFSGLLQLGLTLDLEKLVGWTGGEIYAGAYVIRGHGLSAFEVGNLLTISNIEAERADRLGEVYVKQALFDDALTIKFGQLAADGDFAVSDAAGLFVNSTFGWPGLMGTNLYSGGPAYPVPTPGVHALVKFSEEISFQAGLYNGDPAGRNDVNDHNLGFPLNDGAFAIGEVIYATQAGLFGLPGTYKAGAWHNSLRFEDLRFAGVRHKGDHAVYGVIDQTVWQESDGADLKNPTPGVRSLSAFARAVVTPRSDRNLIDWYLDAGFNAKGFVPGRENDVFGVAAAYAHISKRAQRADRDLADGTPIRSSEIAIEASYKAEIAPWLHMQPFAQYIVRPGGGDPRPNDSTRRIRNATVLGFRTQVEF
jgi:porin